MKFKRKIILLVVTILTIHIFTMNTTVMAMEIEEYCKEITNSSDNSIQPYSMQILNYPSSKYFHATVNFKTIKYRGYSDSGNTDVMVNLCFYNQSVRSTYSFLLDGNEHTLNINLPAGQYEISQVYMTSGESVKNLNMKFYT